MTLMTAGRQPTVAAAAASLSSASASAAAAAAASHQAASPTDRLTDRRYYDDSYTSFMSAGSVAFCVPYMGWRYGGTFVVTVSGGFYRTIDCASGGPSMIDD